MRLSRTSLVMAAVAGTTASMLVAIRPAGATIEVDDLGCHVEATVIPSDIQRIRMDGRDRAARLPTDGTVSWAASTEAAAPGGTGSMSLVIGPWSVTLEQWGPTQPDSRQRASGHRRSLGLAALLPAGSYRVEANHRSPHGACVGHLLVIADGYAFPAYMGIAAAGTLVWALVLWRCGFHRGASRRGRPFIGGLAGGALGSFLAAGLFMLHAFPSDSMALVYLPLTMMLAGATLGIVAPCRRAQRAPGVHDLPRAP